MQNKLSFRQWLVLMIFSLAISGCDSGQQPGPALYEETACPPPEAAGPIVPFLTLEIEGEGVVSVERGAENPGLAVLVGEYDWEDLRLDYSDATSSKISQMNHENKFAIIVFQGRMPTTGHRVYVQQVYEEGDRLVIQACFLDPWQRGFLLAGETITHPYTVIELDRPEQFWKEFVLMYAQEVVASDSFENP